MSSKQDLFAAEFGHYLDGVSADNPVGVCSKCLTCRTRTEVDPQERCPADLARVGLEAVTQASEHDWVGFTERAKLEEFLKSGFPRFRVLAQQAADQVAIVADDDEQAE